MSFYGQIIQQITGALQKITVRNKADAEPSEITQSFILQGDGFIQPTVDENNTIVTLNHITKPEQENNEIQILCYDDDGENKCYKKGTASIDAAGHIIITIGEEKMPLLSCSADAEGNITIA